MEEPWDKYHPVDRSVRLSAFHKPARTGENFSIVRFIVTLRSRLSNELGL